MANYDVKNVSSGFITIDEYRASQSPSPVRRVDSRHTVQRSNQFYNTNDRNSNHGYRSSSPKDIYRPSEYDYSHNYPNNESFRQQYRDNYFDDGDQNRYTLNRRNGNYSPHNYQASHGNYGTSNIYDAANYASKITSKQVDRSPYYGNSYRNENMNARYIPNEPAYNDMYNQPFHRRKYKEPKPFDGCKIEWCDYLQHFLSIAEYNGWSKYEMAKHLKLAFDGPALRYLSEFSYTVLNDFDLLVQELFRRHDPSERAEAWKIEFKNRKRESNESFSKYSQELKRLCSKAYPNMPSIATEQWILDTFIQGLSDREMRKHIQFAHPKSVEEAVSYAIEYDAYVSSCNDYANIRKPKNGELNAIHFDINGQQAEINAINGDTQNSKIKQLENELAEMKKKLDNSNQVSSGRKLECFYCHKPGHIRANCRILKAKLANMNQNQGVNNSESAPKPDSLN